MEKAVLVLPTYNCCVVTLVELIAARGLFFPSVLIVLNGVTGAFVSIRKWATVAN